jgi:hypothetical protein
VATGGKSYLRCNNSVVVYAFLACPTFTAGGFCHRTFKNMSLLLKDITKLIFTVFKKKTELYYLKLIKSCIFSATHRFLSLEIFFLNFWLEDTKSYSYVEANLHKGIVSSSKDQFLFGFFQQVACSMAQFPSTTKAQCR